MQSLMVSIELEREVLKQRSIPVESQGKKVLNLVNKFLYKENPELIKQNEVRQKDLGRSNAYKFFDKHIDMKLYGKKREKGKNIGKISSSKLVDQLNKKTAIAALSLNLLNGFSNILTGTHMTRIESVCQQYFSVKDLAWADATYSKEMPSYLAEKGNNIKESKLHLFIEQFDVMQDFDKYINYCVPYYTGRNEKIRSIKDIIEKDKREFDTWQICRGHDLSLITSIVYSKNMYGQRNVSRSEIENLIHSNYILTRKIKKTDLYRDIKDWQIENCEWKILNDDLQ